MILGILLGGSFDIPCTTKAMSFKSKNLEFEASEPAFLRRLRGQARGNIDDPDRHTNPTALSKAPERLENDEDDAPTYVVEGSNATVTKEEFEKLVSGKSTELESSEAIKASETGKETDQDASKSLKSAQKVAEVGVMSKKRKATRVVGDEDENEAIDSSKDQKVKSSSKKAKSRSKAVKLSFDDEEAG